MIQALRTIPPFIDFGFGDTQASATTGQPIRVWLNTPYDTAYSMALVATGGTYTKVSDYEYLVTYPAAGTFEIKLQVSNPNKTETFESNTLTINVQ